MTSFTASIPLQPSNSSAHVEATTEAIHAALLNGEILLETAPHSAWGGAVTAKMYLPAARSQVWQQITDYPKWVHFFPNLTRSEVIASIPGGKGLARKGKRLYQVARKAVFFFSAQVEIYLRVIEVAHHNTWQQIQFFMEQGTFNDFSADLKLQDYGQGTLLTYSVRATPSFPVPSAVIQEAMKLDLPDNMRQMRRVICQS
ncbi:MAG: SRPBCC family protein [Elainellaceae cyanobacterium]